MSEELNEQVQASQTDNTEINKDVNQSEGEAKPEDRFKPLTPQEKLIVKLKRELKEKESGGSATQLAMPSDKDIEGVAKKYGTNAEFIKEVLKMSAGAIQSSVSKDIGELKARESAKELETAFDRAFAPVIEKSPKLASKKETIKQLAYLPENANKTLTEIADEVFGEFVGRSTTESAKPGTQGERISVNIENPTDDELTIIRANPELKKKWLDYAAKHTH